MTRRTFTVPIILVAAFAATQSIAQVGHSNPRAPLWPQFFAMRPVLPALPKFSGYPEFFAYAAKARGLTTTDAAQRLEAHSTIESLQDYSGEVIVVAKVDLPSADGNYPFYVMRQTSNGLALLGDMTGRSYAWNTDRGHMEFVLDVSGQPAARYQVDGYFLVNLADLASLDRPDPVELNLLTAF